MLGRFPIFNFPSTYCDHLYLKTFQAEIQNLKDQVQELHRDLTKHHSIINTDKMGEILDRSLHVDSQITAQYSAVETMRVMFEEVSRLDGLTFACMCV